MACWIGGILIGCTFVSAVLMIPIDAKLDLMVAHEQRGCCGEESEEEEHKKRLLNSDGEDNEPPVSENDEDVLRMSDVFKLPYVFKIITLTVILVYGESEYESSCHGCASALPHVARDKQISMFWCPWLNLFY